MTVGREIKKKIGSVENTKKVTSAMQMVAASKMRRTQDRMLEARPYSNAIRAVIGHLANSSPEYQHQFMTEREVKRIGFIVVSTDKGQCGGLNTNMFRELLRELKAWEDQGIKADLALIGNKAASFFRSVGGNVVAAINGVGEVPEVESLVGSLKIMLDSFSDGTIDRLDVVSNEFISSMQQKPQIRQLLPLVHSEDPDTTHQWDYIYEPEARDLIDGLVQRHIESQVYQAVVENTACEQAARMIAMKNATDNAENMIEELALLYNNARQAAITQEIAEIVGGAAAL
ncbi:MAG: F0F1 ATP synthase subunit gamma [Gammaproteobacteria bacterium]|nr:F0F1 ATP synthase subunit gamma [Gammaproteobacteria bacterium]MYD80827.1 F0F1 ATP synthase subunit gamma [Gammaproteobacteria bacterium]